MGGSTTISQRIRLNAREAQATTHTLKRVRSRIFACRSEPSAPIVASARSEAPKPTQTRPPSPESSDTLVRVAIARCWVALRGVRPTLYAGVVAVVGV